MVLFMKIQGADTFSAVCYRISKWSGSEVQEGGKVGACTSGRGPWRHINTLYL